ncbi:MAG: hypothetical protein HYT19_00240 [Candidatus Nealsonbacteria bacterium]|nr:hypothetical protein [Candidatus Nealsonbacteria bacterium]
MKLGNVFASGISLQEAMLLAEQGFSVIADGDLGTVCVIIDGETKGKN